MPTWRMKLTPLLRFSHSFSGERPSKIEGVRRSSASVKSHWDSARRSTSLGRAGGWREGDVGADSMEVWPFDAISIFEDGKKDLEYQLAIRQRINR